MSIHNNPLFNYQNRFDYEQKACYLAKCVVVVGIVNAVASQIFGLDSLFYSAAICFVVSELVKGIGLHMRLDAVVSQHQLMGRGS